jgi:hypothetical protein
MRYAPCLYLILLFFPGCESYTGNFDIRGNAVYDNGEPVNQGSVLLDDADKAVTDEQGFFEIPDVPAGRYTLKITSSDSTGRYTSSETDIDLKGGDLDLEQLLLPLPVRLHEAEELSSRSLTLRWDRSHADDFREYKVYIHHSSALDESTGTLLHIATEPGDTVLRVDAGDFWWGGATLTPNTTYYFRVFVMNAYGRHSGSNILEATTPIWDHPEEFTHNYALDLESSFAARGTLTGIAWDGEYFWMQYFQEVGGYDDNNVLSLQQFDYLSGEVLQEFVWEDTNLDSHGITWDGERIWISFFSFIQSVDLQTGQRGSSYYIGEGTSDLAWTGEELVLLDHWNLITLLDPDKGIIGAQFDTPCKAIGYSGSEGVACRDGEIWVINWLHHEITIQDFQGRHIGVADTDFIDHDPDTKVPYRMPMCFMGDRLVIAVDSQVRVYQVTGID